MYRNETISKLQDTINAVWTDHNDLYRRHWQSAGITDCPVIANIDDLQKIPPATKDFFVAARASGGNHTFGPPQESLLLGSSSGSTSGDPFFVWRNGYAGSFYRTLQRYGTKRMLFVWNYSIAPVWSSIMHSLGIEIVVVDPHQLSYCDDLLRSESFDTLSTTPSIATMLPRYLRDTKVLGQFKVLNIGGEALTPVVLHLLRQHYPTAQIFSNFSSIESFGSVGFHAPECGEDYLILHISDEDFVVDIDSENEIAVTVLNSSYALPLIRYKTGDSGTLLKGVCICGRDTPRFKITGRSGVDFVRVCGMELRIEYLQSILPTFSAELKPIMNVVVHEKNIDDRIVALLDITLVLCDGVEDTPSLRERILRALDAVRISPRVTLKQAIKFGLFRPLNIFFDVAYEEKTKNKSIKMISSQMS